MCVKDLPKQAFSIALQQEKTHAAMRLCLANASACRSWQMLCLMLRKCMLLMSGASNSRENDILPAFAAPSSAACTLEKVWLWLSCPEA